MFSNIKLILYPNTVHNVFIYNKISTLNQSTNKEHKNIIIIIYIHNNIDTANIMCRLSK